MSLQIHTYTSIFCPNGKAFLISGTGIDEGTVAVAINLHTLRLYNPDWFARFAARLNELNSSRTHVYDAYTHPRSACCGVSPLAAHA